MQLANLLLTLFEPTYVLVVRLVLYNTGSHACSSGVTVERATFPISSSIFFVSCFPFWCTPKGIPNNFVIKQSINQ